MEMTHEESLANLLGGYETPKTLALEHALDISWIIYSEMKRRDIKNKDLAKMLDVSESRVSQILNMQPNLTLETIASLELALDIRIDFGLVHETKESMCTDNYQPIEAQAYESFPPLKKGAVGDFYNLTSSNGSTYELESGNRHEEKWRWAA
jgi:plasmid maintenance system antidote protein VapI